MLGCRQLDAAGIQVLGSGWVAQTTIISLAQRSRAPRSRFPGWVLFEARTLQSRKAKLSMAKQLSTNSVAAHG